MENAPNRELVDAAKNIVQKIKTIQKHCKENDIDLKSFLSKKEYKGYQTSLLFIKKYSPEIKADALALKEETKSKKPIDEDISEPAFIDAVLQWRKTLLKNLKKAKVNYAEVVIDPKKFSLSVGANLSALPLNTSLYKEWKEILAKIPSPSTGAIVFEALIQNSAETWMLAGNIDALTSHYRKVANKKIYKQYEDTRINEALPQIALFLEAIEASTDSKDKNLPDNVTAKTEVDKAKAEAYQKVLNAWKAEEVANLSIETGDDTVYVDMSMINVGDPRVMVNNLPIELKSNLLTNILTEAKKAGSRRQSVKNLKNISIGAVTTFHRENINENKNYASLSLEDVRAMNFPTNISGWILNYQVSNKDKNPKIQEYASILENWRKSEQASLDSSNASEHLMIDPVSLKMNSNLVSHAGIPDEMRQDFLTAIKSELEQVEKQEGFLNFNQAAGLARNQVDFFARTYNIDNTAFDYKQLEVEEIRQLQFPSGIHAWIKDAEVSGNKKTSKKRLKKNYKLP
ncbi:MAG: hypothetical protein JKY03_06015 [Aureispira sp.]|nr:hypothetical protein [Aureispira sp.]